MEVGDRGRILVDLSRFVSGMAEAFADQVAAGNFQAAEVTLVFVFAAARDRVSPQEDNGAP
jgi:hypothetical protein